MKPICEKARKLPLPLAPKLSAAGGGNSEAERGELQGALARLCEIPGRGAAGGGGGGEPSQSRCARQLSQRESR